MGYVLILGGSSEIARALADKYAAFGYDIYLADKNPELLEQPKQHITEDHGVDVQALKFDVTEFYNHRNFYNSLSPQPFGIICAIDCQGDHQRAQKDFLEAKRMMDINYTGLVAILNIVANDFEERGNGFITAFSYEEDKKEENPDICIYKSAKAGFSVYIEGLRSRLGKSGIKVMTVMQRLEIEEPEKFSEKIFNAWQKGKKDVICAGETGKLAALFKGKRWK